MKKKVFAIVLAAMMVVALVPTLAFAAPSDVTYIKIGETILDEGGDPLPASSGDGWTYAGGVLTLDGYDGGEIFFWPYDVDETLTIVLKNSNTITDGNLRAADGNLVIQGSGSLTINATEGDSAIDVENGTVTFDLSVGGSVTTEAPIPADSTDGSVVPAIAVYDYNYNVGLMTATVDKITLNKNNVIVAPEAGVVALHTFAFDRELLPAGDIKADSPDEPSPGDAVADVKATVDYTFATIKATPDGDLVASATVTGVAPTQPVKADPAGTVVKKTVTPKTGDNGMTGAVMVLMIAGAATAIGLAKRKYN
jgi:hypothetical protein